MADSGSGPAYTGISLGATVELMPNPDERRRVHHGPEMLEFFEALGFRIALDWDETLQIYEPTTFLNPVDVAVAIARHFGPQIRQRMLSDARIAGQVHVGGPYAGQPVHGGRWGEIKLWHRSTAEWHAYIMDRDRKAQYVGQATSRPKARQLAIGNAWEIAKVYYHSPHSYSCGTKPTKS